MRATCMQVKVGVVSGFKGPLGRHQPKDDEQFSPENQRVHVGADGGRVLRSCGAVVLEVVCMHVACVCKQRARGRCRRAAADWAAAAAC